MGREEGAGEGALLATVLRRTESTREGAGPGKEEEGGGTGEGRTEEGMSGGGGGARGKGEERKGKGWTGTDGLREEEALHVIREHVRLHVRHVAVPASTPRQLQAVQDVPPHLQVPAKGHTHEAKAHQQETGAIGRSVILQLNEIPGARRKESQEGLQMQSPWQGALCTQGPPAIARRTPGLERSLVLPVDALHRLEEQGCSR